MRRINYMSSFIKTGNKLILFFIATVFFINELNAQALVLDTIGPTAGFGSFFYGPIYRSGGNANTQNYSRYAYLYTASELGIPAGSKIVKLEWLKKSGGEVTGNNTFNIWMSNSTLSTFPSNLPWNNVINGAVQTYASNTFTIPLAANVFISAPFNVAPNDSFLYSGGNLLIATDWIKSGSASAAINFYTLAASGKSIGLASTTPIAGTTDLAVANYGGSRPTLRISYIAPIPCSGAPNPGNTVASSQSACPGSPITLSLQNNITGGGISYLWQSSNSSSFLPGPNTVNVGTSSSVVVSQLNDTYYRCVVTCINGPVSTNSSVLFLPMSPSYGCYCSSSALSSADEDIIKFRFGSLSNCSNCSTLAQGPGSIQNLYSNYQNVATTPNVALGSVVPFLIEVGVCSNNSYVNRCAMFIDYNKNSIFEASERVYATSAPENGAHIEAGTIVIPPTASLGLCGLRIINSEQGNDILDPCLIYSWGETEDYIINITAGLNCTGSPNPGNTVADISGQCGSTLGSIAICTNKTANLTIQNITSDSSLSYQWFNSAGLIAGATNINYTTLPLTSADTFYCAVKCKASNIIVNSNPLRIAMLPFIDCYCNSFASDDADEEILAFIFNGNSHGTLCGAVAPGPGSIIGRYSNFKTLGNIDTLVLGSSNPFSVVVDDCDTPPAPYYPFGTAIWIDFNHNGSYADAGERIFVEMIGALGPRTVVGNFDIPCTALDGATGMRITVAEGIAGNGLSPCLSYGFGETEDYNIHLAKPTTCNILPGPGATLATVTTFCDSTKTELSLQNKCMYENFTYQWFRNGVAIAGATNNTYTTPMLTETTNFNCKVKCGTDSTFSTTISITKPVFNVSITASAASYCIPDGNPVTLNASGASSYTYLPTTGLNPTTGSNLNATPPTTTTYTVTGTNATGCTKTATITVPVVPCSAGLNLKLFLQGYYKGLGLMETVLKNQGIGNDLNLTDSITVELHETVSPYLLVNSKRVPLRPNGSATASFPTVTGSYYIAIKHRNSLTTWSAVPVPASAGVYDFTTNASKAFGNNMKQVGPGIWAFYSGDLNSDGNIDLADHTIIELGINSFLSGFYSQDINGDGSVDLFDLPVVELNENNFIFAIRP